MSERLLGTKQKDVIDLLDYTIDWSNWVSSGDVIKTSSWQIFGSGAPLLASGFSTSISTGDHKTTVWIASGTPENAFRVSNTIVTVNSRQAQRSFVLQIRDF